MKSEIISSCRRDRVHRPKVTPYAWRDILQNRKEDVLTYYPREFFEE